MTKYSDRFASCARPEIQEVTVVQGTRVQVPKLWQNYTEREKGLAINYKFGCGAEIVEFLLNLEGRLDEITAKLAALETSTRGTSPEVFENLTKIDDRLRSVEKLSSDIDTEVKKSVTPEYVGRIESAMFDRTDQISGDLAELTERVKAIESKPAEAEKAAADAALPAPYNSGE